MNYHRISQDYRYDDNGGGDDDGDDSDDGDNDVDGPYCRWMSIQLTIITSIITGQRKYDHIWWYSIRNDDRTNASFEVLSKYWKIK